jgi:hypothetical protein
MYFNEYNLPIYVESPIDVESLPVEWLKDVEIGSLILVESLPTQSYIHLKLLKTLKVFQRTFMWSFLYQCISIKSVFFEGDQ